MLTPATDAVVSMAILAVEVLLKVAISEDPGQPPVPVPPDQLAQVDHNPSPPVLVQVAVAAKDSLAYTRKEMVMVRKTVGKRANFHLRAFNCLNFFMGNHGLLSTIHQLKLMSWLTGLSIPTVNPIPGVVDLI